MTTQSDEFGHELVNLGSGAHALAIQIMGNSDDAADAVHDAMATALAQPQTYAAEKGPLKPWFLRVVRNQCIDLLRRRRPADTAADELIDAGPGPEQAAANNDRDRVLKLALAAIAPDQRQILVLRDYMDLSYREIAQVLDIAPGTVMSRLHRSRVALGVAYRKYDD